MYKTNIYHKICIIFLCFFTSVSVEAQNLVKRIELKIVPFYIDYARFNPFEDLDNADLMIRINSAELTSFSCDSFYNLISNKKSPQLDEIQVDFIVKCIIYLCSGKKKIVYMNVFGEYLFDNKYYASPKVKFFIFSYIPELYKGTLK